MKFRFMLAGLTIIALGCLTGSALFGSAAAASETESYTIDDVHSSVVFKINHVGASNFYGVFREIAGDFAWNPDDPDQISFNISIPTASVDSRNAGRDRHLKSPDFFNVAEFPAITFKSTSVAPDGSNTYNVTGDLNLHGVTKAMTARVQFIGEADFQGKHRAGFDASLSIKRSDFGMTTYVKEGALGDEVTLMIGIEGIQQ